MKYRPEIDGLRAVAVLPVLMFHAELGIGTGEPVQYDMQWEGNADGNYLAVLSDDPALGPLTTAGYIRGR